MEEEDIDYSTDSDSDVDLDEFGDPITKKSVGSVQKKVKIANDEDDDIEDDDDLDADLDADDMDAEGMDAEGDDDDESSVGDLDIPNNATFGDIQIDDDDDDDDDDEYDENYLQKFDANIEKNIIRDYHPELKVHSFEEISAKCTIVYDEAGNIVDPFHKTMPFVTKYERARILGERAKQINSGAEPFVEVDDSVIDGYLIALKEYEEKKIPFIVQRPLPNGDSEYWRLKDLEMI
jgi:DNA-directed RNA polymerase I, II, and III subunit RPABC2